MDSTQAARIARIVAAAPSRLGGRQLVAANARRVLAVSQQRRSGRRITTGEKARAVEFTADMSRLRKRDATGR
jgi:hypothetical protein